MKSIIITGTSGFLASSFVAFNLKNKFMGDNAKFMLASFKFQEDNFEFVTKHKLLKNNIKDIELIVDTFRKTIKPPKSFKIRMLSFLINTYYKIKGE